VSAMDGSQIIQSLESRTCILCDKTGPVMAYTSSDTGAKVLTFWACYQEHGTWGLCLDCARKNITPEILQKTIEARYA